MEKEFKRLKKYYKKIPKMTTQFYNRTLDTIFKEFKTYKKQIIKRINAFDQKLETLENEIEQNQGEGVDYIPLEGNTVFSGIKVPYINSGFSYFSNLQSGQWNGVLLDFGSVGLQGINVSIETPVFCYYDNDNIWKPTYNELVIQNINPDSIFCFCFKNGIRFFKGILRFGGWDWNVSDPIYLNLSSGELVQTSNVTENFMKIGNSISSDTILFNLN